MRTVVLAFVVTLGFLLGCGGLAPASPGEACCSVEDVVQLTRDGVGKDVIIATIRTSGTDLALSATDIGTMTQAGVDAEVIDVLNGGPCVCEALPEPEPVAVAPVGGGTKKPAAPAGINVTVKYTGGGNFELVNLSNTTYTNLVIVANGEYQYKLKKLPANTADSIRLVSFRSRKSGVEMKRKTKLRSIAVSSDQGGFSKSF